MDKVYFLGIDAGTTSIKAVIFSSTGEEIHIGSVSNRIVQPQSGWCEQDMNLLWDLTSQTIKKTMVESGISPALIKAVGLTGQGEGCWLIDANGTPCRNAILWNDTRAIPLIGGLSKKTQDLIKRVNGSVAGAGRTSVLLAWLTQNEPDTLQRAAACFACKDWLRYKLTGRIAYEISDASAGVLDLNTNQASPKIFRALGIGAYMKIIPEVIPSLSPAGVITEEAAKECGLCVGTVVSGGFMDVVACPAGMGATHPGDVNTILGTACVNGIVQEAFNIFKGYSGYTVSADNGRYLCLIGSMAGVQNMDWVRATLLAPLSKEFDSEGDFFSFIDSQISEIPVGSGKIVYHPYIKNSGERAPFRNTNARAGFFGISEDTTLWHLVRSVYEGVALSIKDCMQGISPKRLFLSGGGANSMELRQIIADCLNCTVITSSVKEIGAKGAAISAGIAAGYFKNLDEATKAFQTHITITSPRAEYTYIYKELYKIYYNLRVRHGDIWDQRANL